MARRTLLPSLRTPAKDISEQAETKTITIGTYRSSSVLTSFGMEDRAAGWDLNTVIVDGYERSVWVYRCVEKMAGDQARLPFRIGRNLGEDDEETLDDHPLYRLLNRRANPAENGRHFRHRVSQQLFLSKRGVFVEVGKTRLGTPNRLDLLPPDRVTPVPADNGDYVKHFEFTRRDGVVREIAPERIRWIRSPHPTDPFSGTTPLEAAGMSVELDKLARTYTIQFIKNDGRPGGLIAIDADGMSDQAIAKVERALQPGVNAAGHVAMVGTGPGGVKYVDLSTTPRDMNYGEALQFARLETLAAFGIGESQISDASGRTFDNAEQEEYNYWTGPQRTHHELIAAAFEPDVDEGWEPYFDTSGIDSLDLPARRAREEAREEVDAGLRSIDEYRPLAKLEPVRNAQTRALWVSPAKAPIPTDPADAEALGGGTEVPGGAPQGGAQAGAPGAGTAADAVAAARGDVTPGAGTAADAVNAARAGAPAGSTGTAEGAVAAARVSDGGSTPGGAAAAVDAARIGDSGSQPGDAAEAVAAAREAKAAQLQDAPGGVQYDPGEADLARAETAIAGTMDAVLARHLGVVTARLESPKTRKGTRFWAAAGPTDTRGGVQPLDGARVVDEDRWAEETQDALAPVVQDNAMQAASDLLAAFVTAGAIDGVNDPAALAGDALRAAAVPALTAVTIAVEAIRGWSRRIARVIDVEAQAATSIDDVTAAVRAEHAAHGRAFSDAIAVTVGQTTVAGARDNAATSLTPVIEGTAVVRSWLTRADAQVRDSHAAVAGTTLPVGERFPVGEALLRYPGDPFGPPDQTRNCRCRCAYRAAAGARFTTPTTVKE